jgi:hypothetical protein
VKELTNKTTVNEAETEAKLEKLDSKIRLIEKCVN